MEQVHPKPQVIALWGAIVELQRTWRDFLPAPDINKSLFGVLMCVAHGPIRPGKPPEVPNGPVAVGTIAAQLHQSLPAISQKLSALEEQGYITRLADAKDRRVTCVALTEMGREKLDKSRVCFETRLDVALDALGEEKTAQLMSLMQELTAALKEKTDKGDSTIC
ncbi:MAG: MarR family transcriptional regulator [Ruthenibacterium sp.]